MSKPTKHHYEFGPFRIDARERLLFRDGEIVPLPPKIFDTLLVLVEGGGHLLDKDELIKQVWPDTFVEEGNLTRNVSTLRSVLGEGEDGHHYIETIPRRGYRFVAGVKELVDEGAEVIVQERTRSSVTIEEETSQGIFESARESANRSVEMVAARTSSSAEYLVNQIKRHKRVTVAAGAALVIAVAGITFGLYRFFSKPTVPFQTPSIVKLTTNGKAVTAAISPDGKYVVYAEEEAGLQSVWLRQVAAVSNSQIVAPAQVQYLGLTFSPDGNFVYFVRREQFDPNPFGVLYQVPALGGNPRKLIENLNSPIALSPDGKRLAFLRGRSFVDGEVALMVADASGVGEPEKLTSRRMPEFFTVNGKSGLAWSPDGKIIACTGGSLNPPPINMYVIGVQVEDGTQKRITAQNWNTASWIAWLSDGSGLIMTARTGVTQSNHQPWHISYPDGEARMIYNDLSDYEGMSLTSDNKALVTMQSRLTSNVWVVPNEGPRDGFPMDVSRARQIPSLLGWYPDPLWTPDGRIVYTSQASGGQAIWIMDADGSNNKQLTFDHGSIWPSVSRDGRHIVFIKGPATWRMELDGSNPKQIRQVAGPSIRCSPDGRWVVYTSARDRSTLWKCSTDGGDPVQVSNQPSGSFDISPDGKLIAVIPVKGGGRQPILEVIPFEGGPPIKTFDLPPGFGGLQHRGGLCWTRDGNALTYIDTRGGVSNIWSQPMDGSKPVQLTNFESDRIFRFDWSFDGKRLVCARGSENRDVVLIRDSR